MLTVGIIVTSLLAVLVHAMPGDLDLSFDTDGKVITAFASGSNSAMATAIQADGKIVAAGESTGKFALARYNTDGSLDTNFNGDGKVTTAIGVFDAAFALGVQADDKIVAVGGTSPSGFCCQFALARYNTDGSLDASFDADGKVTTAFGGDSRAFAMAIQPNGQIVVAGGTSTPFGGNFAVARFNTDGSLDGTFGSGGKVTTDFNGFDQANGLAIQADGKIVAAGSGGSANDFVLARYNTDGSLDATFGTGGKVTTDFGGFDRASSIALQADGKIVTAGYGGVLTRFAVARYNADGSLDSTFDGDGKVTTGFFGENIEGANALAIQQNGKIVVVGSVMSAFDPSFAVARYNPDGNLDLSFGIAGKVTTDFGNPGDVGVLCPPSRKDCSNDSAMGVALQHDGMIVVAGGAGPCTPACSFALARYTDDFVADVTPPVIVPTVAGTLGLGGWYTSDIVVSWIVTDSESPVIDKAGCSPTSITADTEGETFTCTATSAGGTSSQSVTVKRDATPPTMQCSANPSVLWPPNRKLLAIAISVAVSDLLSGPTSFILDSLATSEGELSPDMVGWTLGASDLSGFLRASRLGTNNGRVYTLLYEGADGAGNKASCNVGVSVPHDLGQ